MSNITDWEFTEKHVEPGIIGGTGEKNQNFISAESIVMCAAPPTANLMTGPEDIIPIGILESAAIVQNKQIQQLFEIGSRKPYFIPGRTRVQIGLSRVIFNGNSLMAKVYGNTVADDEAYTLNNSPGLVGNVADEKYYFNLASSFFNKPFGLVLIMRDSDKDDAAMVYLENCMIQSHQMNVGAASTIIMENCNILCDGVQPVHVVIKT